MGAKNLPALSGCAGWELELEIDNCSYWKREALLARITRYQQEIALLEQREIGGSNDRTGLWARVGQDQKTWCWQGQNGRPTEGLDVPTGKGGQGPDLYLKSRGQQGQQKGNGNSKISGFNILTEKSYQYFQHLYFFYLFTAIWISWSFFS